MQDETNMEGQGRVARLVALKRHERPGQDHWLGLSRAVRFRIEQEMAEQRAATRRSAGSAWGRWVEAAMESGWGRWLDPSAWLPTVLAVVAILTWMLPPTSGVGPGASNMAGLGNVPEVGMALGLERPRVAPINGVRVRVILLDSDQLPAGFVAFPPLSAAMLEPRR